MNTPEQHGDLSRKIQSAIETRGLAIKVLYMEAMHRHTTFKIGGPADALAFPATVLELRQLMQLASEEKLPIQLLGGGANILVQDRGIRGLVVSTKAMQRYIELPDNSLYAAAGLPVDRLCDIAAAKGLGGLEFLAGLPGSIGGAVYMNARCYEREIADVAMTIDYLASDNSHCDLLALNRADWSYKKTPFMPGGSHSGCVVLGARFKLQQADRQSIVARMQELRSDRKKKGHFDFPSAGSLFKNNRDFGRPTGAILDELGFRGRRIGDAMVSPKHANIFVNAGRATAVDMLALIKTAQDAASAAFGYELEPEVIFLGE